MRSEIFTLQQANQQIMLDNNTAFLLAVMLCFPGLLVGLRIIKSNFETVEAVADESIIQAGLPQLQLPGYEIKIQNLNTFPAHTVLRSTH